MAAIAEHDFRPFYARYGLIASTERIAYRESPFLPIICRPWFALDPQPPSGLKDEGSLLPLPADRHESKTAELFEVLINASPEREFYLDWLRRRELCREFKDAGSKKASPHESEMDAAAEIHVKLFNVAQFKDEYDEGIEWEIQPVRNALPQLMQDPKCYSDLVYEALKKAASLEREQLGNILGPLVPVGDHNLSAGARTSSSMRNFEAGINGFENDGLKFTYTSLLLRRLYEAIYAQVSVPVYGVGYASNPSASTPLSPLPTDTGNEGGNNPTPADMGHASFSALGDGSSDNDSNASNPGAQPPAPPPPSPNQNGRMALPDTGEDAQLVEDKRAIANTLLGVNLSSVIAITQTRKGDSFPLSSHDIGLMYAIVFSAVAASLSSLVALRLLRSPTAARKWAFKAIITFTAWDIIGWMCILLPGVSKLVVLGVAALLCFLMIFASGE